MTELWGILERAAGRVAFYPRWARALFGAALASMVVSVIVFAFAAPSRESVLRREVGLALSLGGSEANAPRYGYERRGGTLLVAPELPYLALLDRGGPIDNAGGDAWGWSNWDAANYLPVLNVNLTNNSARTILITEASVEVERSRADLRPIPVIGLCCRARRLELENAGWADLEDVVLRFDIERPGQVRFEPPYRHRIAVGGVGATRAVDLSDALRAEGVDVSAVEQVERRFRADPLADLDAQERRALRRAMQPFAAGQELRYPGPQALAVGVIEHGLGAARDRVRFSARFTLADLPSPLGPPPPDIDFVVHARLDAVGAKYERFLDMRDDGEFLPPGEAGRFALEVSAPRSSRHVFRLHLRTNDGLDLLSGPVDLSLFVPRTHAEPELGRWQSDRSGQSP